MEKIEKFPAEVIEKLKNYVYRLIDPRNGETIYVGRGVGNRLFAHVKDELGEDGDEVDDKLKRIREIRLAGFDVAHVVHRHGMEIEVAKEVEAALIDAYPGSTNISSGDGSGSRGVMHVNEIMQEYLAKPAVFRHRALLISINRTALEMSLYEAVRFAWRLSAKRASEAQVVLAVQNGIIKGAFIPQKWLPATKENFPERFNTELVDRLGFIGEEAPDEIKRSYIGCRLPDDFRFGVGNPVRYTW